MSIRHRLDELPRGTGDNYTYVLDGRIVCTNYSREYLPVSDSPPRHRFHPLHECPDLDTCSMISAACFY